MYSGYVCKVKNIRNHSNADRLNVGECYSNQVIISKNITEDMLGVYFPSDGQLGERFCIENNLVRKKDENGNNIGGYLDPNKRNIKALKLRGEISDGLWLPISCLSYLLDVSILTEGFTISVLDNEEICKKYIPKTNKRTERNGERKSSKRTDVSYPFFQEHGDTLQYNFNKNYFKQGDLITISLKMHGTSHRIAYTKKITNKNSFISKILSFLKLDSKKENWEYISGTRRVVLADIDDKGGFYGTNEFRKKHHEQIVGKLHKGETIYGEIVGYVNDSTTIMSSCDNEKLNDKSFIAKYGDKTIFSYDCKEGESQLYVYRMTLTTEEGHVIEYTTDQILQRCEEIGVKVVPIFERFFFSSIEELDSKVNAYIEGVDPIGKTHIKEGVVIRVENRKGFKVFKQKSFEFKLLEGIIKETAETPDMEEIQECDAQ